MPPPPAVSRPLAVLPRLRKAARRALRRSVAALPQDWRFGLYRRMVQCDPRPDPRLVLKIADTREELEACFGLLHDAYVDAGFMKPDPSGMRVTVYHALPTTTTLCALWDGEVVGTISMIREGVFGFPMQSAFDLSSLRVKEGQIAEISALAVHPKFRKTGGQILFPLMKFMYAYCRWYFDTRHLVIAVNPNRIELYESLLFFQRLPAEVSHYDFANGAPAVGATLDLHEAEAVFEQAYAHKPAARNLHGYFVHTELPNIRLPRRPLHTTNDPVMTPAMLDHFFNRRTQAFEALDTRRRLLLRTVYDHADYASVLPACNADDAPQAVLRRHQRFSLRCPATMHIASYGATLKVPLEVLEISSEGLGACSVAALPEGTRGVLQVELGPGRTALVEATSVRCRSLDGHHHYGFRLDASDSLWRRTVRRLEGSFVHADLHHSTTTALPRLPQEDAVVTA